MTTENVEETADDERGGADGEARPLPRLDGVEHRFADLPGVRMHVAEAGSGEPVLLLHGVPQHWWEWHQVVPGLAAHYRLICPDLRGLGWTDAPRSGYTTDQQVADLLALLDALDAGPVHLLTHDVGSIIGYQLCLREPDRVRTHLALSITPPYLEVDVRFIRTVLTLGWYNLLVRWPGLGPVLFRRGPQHVARTMLAGAVGGPRGVSAQDLETYLAQLREPARARAVSAFYRDLIHPEGVRMLNGTYRGQRLRTPTRVLLGADDPVMRRELLHGFEQHADDLSVEEVERAGHFIADEEPDAVVAHALELFAGR